MPGSVTPTRRKVVLILVVFSVVITLFSGHHALSALNGHGVSPHSDNFICLFLICVAIVFFSMLFAFLASTSMIPETFPTPKASPLFLLEKPPRGASFSGIRKVNQPAAWTVDANPLDYLYRRLP